MSTYTIFVFLQAYSIFPRFCWNIYEDQSRSSHSDDKKCNYSISGSSVCQFLSTIIISHLLANWGHIYHVCSSSSLPSTLISALLPFLSSSCLLPGFLSSFSSPHGGDTAINLRVANELHLTIKCTGNGTFHLQEDQWQWQTPFSERLVSGMMFRRQSNQSPHTDAEINQRREKKWWEGAFIFILYSWSLFK